MNKEIKKSIIKMYELLKEQDLVYYDEMQKIIDYIWELEKEIERLNKECDTYVEVATRKEKRIRKAIEYIEKNYYDTVEDFKGYVIATIGVEELLDILKGGKDE